jgi:phage gpG-like protein
MFHRIGMKVSADMKLLAARQRIIDRGHLVNSLRYEFVNDRPGVTGINVGSFNVVYAAMNEFGGNFTDRQRRAMFASLSDRYGGKIPKRARSGTSVIQGNYWRPRPFIRPAVKMNQKYIVDMIRTAFRDAP